MKYLSHTSQGSYICLKPLAISYFRFTTLLFSHNQNHKTQTQIANYKTQIQNRYSVFSFKQKRKKRKTCWQNYCLQIHTTPISFQVHCLWLFFVKKKFLNSLHTNIAMLTAGLMIYFSLAYTYFTSALGNKNISLLLVQSFMSCHAYSYSPIFSTTVNKHK